MFIIIASKNIMNDKLVKSYKICILLILVCFSYNGNTQNLSYKFDNLNPSNGLSQSSVIKIYQDRLGQMWIGTRNGLNKYDGSSFKIFRNDPKAKTSISNNDIITILEDISGNIWIGTYNGLNKYNPRYESFENYFHDSKNDNTLPDNIIIELEDMGEEMWIGTSNGLSIYNKKRHTFINIFEQINNESSIPSNNVLSILKTKEGNIFIGTRKGLCKLISRQDNTFQFYRIKDKSAKDLVITDLVEKPNGNIWVATKNEGLYELDIAKNELHSLSSKKEFINLDKDIRALSLDNKNNLWIGTISGLSILSANNYLNSLIKTNPELKKIRSILTDKNGSVWIGTYYGGVYFWDKSNTNFKNITEIDSNILSYDVVSSIVANQEDIYFGTEGGGVSIFNNSTKKITYLNKANFNKLASDEIKAMMLIDSELWLGTFLSGISIYDIKTEKINNSSISLELQKLLKQTGVYSFAQANNETIWIGTFGKGVINYDLATKAIKELNLTNGLTSNFVRSVLIDSKKRIWIATLNGLNVLNVNDFEVEKFKINQFFYEANSNSGTDILTVFEDSNQNIWVGTKSKGLFKIKDNSIEKVLLKNEEFEVTTIKAIIEDSKKMLWLSSDIGILKYNTLHKTIKIYNQKDGLINNEFNDNSSLKFKNQLYFGGIKGVTLFNTEKITINKYSPQVIITDFKIKDKLIKADSSSKILKKNITYTKNIELAYDNSNFSIKFAIPNFVSPKNNFYSYRMVGLEDHWITTSNNEAIYAIQNPGTYTFEVRGANNDGIWNTTPTALKIILKPAPWKTWWAYVLYCLLIICICFYVLRFLKSKEILKHDLRLKNIENQKKEETHQAKLNFFTNISHEFRTPLTLILGPLQQILSEYSGSNILYKKLLIIESNANHLLQLINRLMDFRKFEDNQFRLEAAEGNIIKFLQEIFLSFTDFAKNGNYTYTFNTTNDEILVFYDRQMLERVFYNLLSNAFRYTPKGGCVSINVTKEEKHVVIEIDDTGVGISEEYIDKVFDRFFEIPTHNKSQKNYNKGTGIGLSIVKNIITLHHGSITVEIKPSQGTIFKVVLLIGKNHLSEQEISKDFTFSEDLSQYVSQLSSFPKTQYTDINDFEIEEKKYTVLLVEDNNELRSFMKNLLKNEYNILQAENGKVAMKIAIKKMPDLIISDVVMPEMAGTELCSLIKGDIRTSHIPVILLTSRTSLIYKFEGLERGADDYISKPFNLQEFRLRIKNLLESKERLKNKFSSENYFRPNNIVTSSLDEQLLKKAFKIVETNISNEEFDIVFFAKELGVSRTVLFSKIKAWTNFTPNEFIIEIRLKRAIQLLEQSEINISEVSDMVGFKDPKYFSKCFRKKIHLSPSQYRNQFLKRNVI